MGEKKGNVNPIWGEARVFSFWSFRLGDIDCRSFIFAFSFATITVKLELIGSKHDGYQKLKQNTSWTKFLNGKVEFIP